VKNWRQVSDFVRRTDDFAGILRLNGLETSGFQKNFTNREKSV
jgi:hypothetical protein